MIYINYLAKGYCYQEGITAPDKSLDAITRHLPVFADQRVFLGWAAAQGDLMRVAQPVATRHQMTAVQMRLLRAGGQVLRFDRPVLPDERIAAVPVVTNLFGTTRRVAAGLGLLPEQIADLGWFLAEMRSPAPVDGMRDAWSRWQMLKAALSTRPKVLRHATVQDIVTAPPDLTDLPVQTCWSGDAGPLITWPVVLTRPYGSDAQAVGRYNAGVYRAQVLGADRLILRWLAHRGGAAHHRSWARAGEAMPVAVVLGADPATLLAAALPLPETISELAFSGVLRGARTELVPARTVPLLVPANAEMVLEGWVSPTETAPEGPFGDHTGYYNAVEPFPVMQVTALTHRRDPLYLSTSTGRPPDEPSVIGEVFNALALPVIRQQSPGSARPVAAARRLFLPHCGDVNRQALSGSGTPGHDDALGDAAAVQLYQDGDRGRRRYRRAQLGRYRPGAGHADGPGSRCDAAGTDADGLS